MLCTGESQASVLGSWSRAGEQARFAEAIGEQPRWGIWVNSTSGKCLWVASLESFDTPIFSGASQLGRTAWHKDVGIWQMPGTFSHFRAGPEPSASSERPWHWVFPGGMEGFLGGERRGEGLHPRTACLWAGSCSPVVSPLPGSPTLLRSAEWLMRTVKKLRLDNSNAGSWRR